MDYTNRKIQVLFSWDGYPRQGSAGLIGNLLSGNHITTIDCDASAILCGADGRPICDGLQGCVIYYDNQRMFDGAIEHGGDNTINDINSEIITIDLKKLPETVKAVLLTLDVFKCKEKKSVSFRKNHTQMVKICDADSKEELETFNYFGIPSNGIRLCGILSKNDDGTWSFKNKGKHLDGIKSKEDLLSLSLSLKELY